MRIKRIENYNGTEMTTYMQENGFFGRKETARIFNDREDAEELIDMEKSDPMYDKGIMGECTFEIEED